jgi:hypothetical protein
MTKKSDTGTNNGEEEGAMSQNFEQNLDEFRKAVNFGNTYPAAQNATLSAGPTLGPGPTSNLQQVVSQTLQGVLGRSFKPGDTESFKAALDVSFEVEEIGGKDVFTHVPRAYPSIGATDMGAGISGAQYSLVSFAKGLHEQTQPLIRNLHSLNANVDDQEFEATKSIFMTAWDELIAELSREGGPRASRADALASSIFNDTGAGHLTDLGNQLGVIKGVLPAPNRKIDFDRGKVVTKEEEGFLTNFIALSDYYFAVAQAWINYSATFFADLGTGLLKIERVLAVVGAAVNEVYAAMDSVSIDEHERLVIVIGLPAPNSQLTIEDLLSWISSFVSREAPQLIRDGGKRGITAIIPTAGTLKTLVGAFVTKISKGTPVVQKVPPLPTQLNHDRVLNPLIELQQYLERLEAQATEITT